MTSMLHILWWKRHVEEVILWSQLRVYVTYWPNYLCTISSFTLFPKHSEVFCMHTVFEKGRCLKWNTLLALLIFHPDFVMCLKNMLFFSLGCGPILYRSRSQCGVWKYGTWPTNCVNLHTAFPHVCFCYTYTETRNCLG